MVLQEIKKPSKGTQKTWDKFPKPAVNVAAPFIGMAVGAKTKILNFVRH